MSGALIAGAAIGAVGSGVSAGMGASASAAATKAQQQMAEMQMRYLNAVMKPYRQTGAKANRRQLQMAEEYAKRLGEFTRPYGMDQYRESPLYTPMVSNLAELQATPGYQYELQQGQQALAQTAAARGGLLSGAQQRAAGNYAQRQAATGFQNAWQRAQQAYSSAFQQDLAQRGQAAQMYGAAPGLFGPIADRGMQAAGAAASGMAQQGANYANAQSANAYGQAGAINQGVQGLLGAGMSIYGMYGGGAGGAGGAPGYISPGGAGAIY